MSHFKGIVIGDDWKQQLEPYSENLEVPEYITDDGDKTTYNPESKWDWYQVGGRWSGSLLVKKGKTGTFFPNDYPNVPRAHDGGVDQARKGDIDFEAMLVRNKANAIKSWEEAQTVDGILQCFQYGIEKEDTQESYVAKRSSPITTRVIVKDGRWYEIGEMGWFGMSHGDKDEKEWQAEVRKLLSDLPDDTLITVVDFHI